MEGMLRKHGGEVGNKLDLDIEREPSRQKETHEQRQRFGAHGGQVVP